MKKRNKCYELRAERSYLQLVEPYRKYSGVARLTPTVFAEQRIQLRRCRQMTGCAKVLPVKHQWTAPQIMEHSEAIEDHFLALMLIDRT